MTNILKIQEKIKNFKIMLPSLQNLGSIDYILNNEHFWLIPYFIWIFSFIISKQGNF